MPPRPPAHLARTIIAAALLATPSVLPAQQAFKVEVHGEGPPILLIPGLMSGGDVWTDVVDRWRGTYELHVLTLPGFAGVPSIPGERQLERARDAIIAYIRERELRRPVIVGHSLGAFLGFAVASHAPELVGGLVAVDGVPFLPALGDSTASATAMRGRAESMRAMYASLTAGQMAMQARMAAAGMMRDTNHAARAVEWARTSDPATVGSAMAEMLTTDLRDQIRAIRAPVLLVAAGGAAASPEDSARLHARYAAQLARVPDARVIVAANALHFVMLDDPDFFHRAVDPFLAGAVAERVR